MTEQILEGAVQMVHARTAASATSAHLSKSRRSDTVIQRGPGVCRPRSRRQRLHEEPQIPNYGKRGTGPALRAGMTLAIEPMMNMGKAEDPRPR